MHRHTKNLRKLVRPPFERQQLRLVLSASDDTTGQHRTHGFGIIIQAADIEIGSVRGYSDTSNTSQNRGYLAGFLTSLEWMHLNGLTFDQVTIVCRHNYIHSFLDNLIASSVKMQKAAHPDLLSKIKDAARGLGDLRVVSPTGSDKAWVKAALNEARPAIQDRDRQPSITEYDVDDLGSLDWDDDTEAAFQRALSRDH